MFDDGCVVSMAENDKNNFAIDLDVGNLCITRIVELKSSIERDISESKLKRIASVGVQELLNNILSLPCEYHGHIPVAKLPEPSTAIPREKPIPKEKPPTKWEKFAKAKGIQKPKKEKLVWDEASKEWKPQYGYKSAKNQSEWLIEVPDNADPNADYFGKKKEEKKERIAKNEYQRLRNISVSQKMKVTNLESVDQADKHQLSRSVAAAKSATASLGKFTQKLPMEKPPKNSMQKRKFKSNFEKGEKEKENNLKIFAELSKKKPKLNVAEAVQRYVTKPIKEKSAEKSAASAKKKNAKKNKLVKNLYRSGSKFVKNFYRSGSKKGFKKT